MRGTRTAAHVGPAPTRPPGRVSSLPRILIVMVAAVLVQFALVAAFTGVTGSPTLRSADVGIVPQDPAQPAPALPGVAYQPLHSVADARQQVADGSLPAALVTSGKSQTLYLDGSSAGLSLATVLKAEFGAAAGQTHAHLAVTDLRPLPASDPRGLGTFVLGLGWVIGGYLGMVLLTRVLGAATRTRRGALLLLAAALGYALLSAVAGVVLMDPIMGVITSSPWQLIGAGTLIVFTVGVFTAALMSLLKMLGLILAIGTLVILGNPTSGGSVPVQMMAGGWRFLADVLPPNAGISFIRSFAYLDGNQMTRPLTVLLIYTAASVVLLLGLAVRHGRTAPPTTQDDAAVATTAAGAAGPAI